MTLKYSEEGKILLEYYPSPRTITYKNTVYLPACAPCVPPASIQNVCRKLLMKTRIILFAQTLWLWSFIAKYGDWTHSNIVRDAWPH